MSNKVFPYHKSKPRMWEPEKIQALVFDRLLDPVSHKKISKKTPGKVPEENEELPSGEVDRDEVS